MERRAQRFGCQHILVGLEAQHLRADNAAHAYPACNGQSNADCRNAGLHHQQQQHHDDQIGNAGKDFDKALHGKVDFAA